jgi:hypothetical protein
MVFSQLGQFRSYLVAAERPSATRRHHEVLEILGPHRWPRISGRACLNRSRHGANLSVRDDVADAGMVRDRRAGAFLIQSAVNPSASPWCSAPAVEQTCKNRLHVRGKTSLLNCAASFRSRSWPRSRSRRLPVEQFISEPGVEALEGFQARCRRPWARRGRRDRRMPACSRRRPTPQSRKSRNAARRHWPSKSRAPTTSNPGACKVWATSPAVAVGTASR